MKNYAKVAALLGLSAVTLSASGWRIPEQSLNSTALSAAYVAGANGADSSYYNPANMVWMDEGSEIEMAFTYINLAKINYTDSVNPAFNGQSKEEKFYVPTFHYVSPAVGDFRFGLSMVAPGGLSKRWDSAYAKASAEEFTLEVIEINPTIAYKVNDKFAVGFGLRGIYSSGIIKSDATGLNPASIARDMEADSIDFGYNLALSYKATENLTLASTYRSKVDLTETGTADLSAGGKVVFSDIYAAVTVPLPASFTLAAAYTMNKTVVEFVFERTYWSAYDTLDFEFRQNIGGFTVPFDKPKAKNWKDVNAYRIGVIHQYNDKLKLMAGFAIDKNPAPSSTVGFELPESDAKLYSAGLEYKINDKMKIGLAYLYDQKEERTVNNRSATEPTAANGTFTDAAAHLITMSMKYRF